MPNLYCSTSILKYLLSCEVLLAKEFLNIINHSKKKKIIIIKVIIEIIVIIIEIKVYVYYLLNYQCILATTLNKLPEAVTLKDILQIRHNHSALKI